jgi:hypothetical protein
VAAAEAAEVAAIQPARVTRAATRKAAAERAATGQPGKQAGLQERREASLQWHREARLQQRLQEPRPPRQPPATTTQAATDIESAVTDGGSQQAVGEAEANVTGFGKEEEFTTVCHTSQPGHQAQAVLKCK